MLAVEAAAECPCLPRPLLSQGEAINLGRRAVAERKSRKAVNQETLQTRNVAPFGPWLSESLAAFCSRKHVSSRDQWKLRRVVWACSRFAL